MILLLPALLFAAPITPEKPKVALLSQVLDGLQAEYKNTKSFEADFTQNYYQYMPKKHNKNSGTVFFKQPGLMRWDYAPPNLKNYIVNNHTQTTYLASTKTAYVDKCFKADALTTSLSFLWGMGNLKKDFNASFFEGQYGEKTDLHLELKPKVKSAFFKSLILVLDPKTYRIKQSVVVDTQKNINQFIYTSFHKNKAVPDSRFIFKTPNGATVQVAPHTCNQKDEL